MIKKLYLSIALFFILLLQIHGERPIGESDKWDKALGSKHGSPLWSGIIPRVSEYKKSSNRQKRQAEEEGGGDEDENLEGGGEAEEEVAPAGPVAAAAEGEIPLRPQIQKPSKYKIRTRPNYQNTGVDQGLASEPVEETFVAVSGGREPAKPPAAQAPTQSQNNKQTSSNSKPKASSSQSQSETQSKDGTTIKPGTLQVGEDLEETEPTEPIDVESTTSPSLIPVVANIIKSIVGGNDNVTKPLNVTHTLNYASNLILSPFGLEFNFLSPLSKHRNTNNNNAKQPNPSGAKGTAKPKPKPRPKPKPTPIEAPPPQETVQILPETPAIPQPEPQLVVNRSPQTVISQAPVPPQPPQPQFGIEKTTNPDTPFVLYRRTVGPATTTTFRKLVAPFRDFPFISPTVHPSAVRQQPTQKVRNTTPYAKLVGAFQGRAISNDELESNRYKRSLEIRRISKQVIASDYSHTTTKTQLLLQEIPSVFAEKVPDTPATTTTTTTPSTTVIIPLKTKGKTKSPKTTTTSTTPESEEVTEPPTQTTRRRRIKSTTPKAEGVIDVDNFSRDVKNGFEGLLANLPGLFTNAKTAIGILKSLTEIFRAEGGREVEESDARK